MNAQSISDVVKKAIGQLPMELQSAAWAQVGQVCANMGSGNAAALMKANGNGNGAAHKCKEGCGCEDCTITTVLDQQCNIPSGAAPPYQVVPGCYGDCNVMPPCLRPFMLYARFGFDDQSWLELNKRESDLVHYNTVISDGPNFLNNFPLTANTAIITVQEAGQQLPYLPGIVKVTPSWNGDPVPANVTVQIYSGPRDLQVVTDPEADGLITVGRAFTLADWICGDDCTVVPYPRLFNCLAGPIPHQRRLFFRFTATDIGAAEVTSINTTIYKRDTFDFKRCCKQYDMLDLFG